MWPNISRNELKLKIKSYWMTWQSSIESWWTEKIKGSNWKQTTKNLYNASERYLKYALMFVFGLILGSLLGCGPKYATVVKRIPPPTNLLILNIVPQYEPTTNGELLELYLKTEAALGNCNADKTAIERFYSDGL